MNVHPIKTDSQTIRGAKKDGERLGENERQEKKIKGVVSYRLREGEERKHPHQIPFKIQ